MINIFQPGHWIMISNATRPDLQQFYHIYISRPSMQHLNLVVRHKLYREIDQPLKLEFANLQLRVFLYLYLDQILF
jgi:hypothetical protein